MTIDSKTKISLFTIAGMIPLLFTCIWGLASLTINSELRDKDKDLRITKLEMKSEQKDITDQVLWLDVRERLIRLETLQGVKPKGVKHE